MSKRKKEEDEIRKEDCPDWIAKGYPGKFSKDKPSGTLMSKEEWKEDQVRRWFDHISENQKYESTSLAHKVRYLVPHLKMLNVKPGQARTLLVKVELEKAEEIRGLQGGDVIVGGDGAVNQDEEGDAVEDNPGDGGEGVGGGREGVGEEMDCDENNEESDVESEMDCDDQEGRSVVDLEVRKYLERTDHELFESGLVIPSCVQKSRKFKARKREFIRVYMEESELATSQEVLENLSQAPEAVQETLKETLAHLTKQEKANRLLVKTLSDTVKRLKETPGKEARRQVQIILAATSHHR